MKILCRVVYSFLEFCAFGLVIFLLWITMPLYAYATEQLSTMDTTQSQDFPSHFSSITQPKQYACVEDAVRDSILAHFGYGQLDEKDFLVAGVSIMEQRAERANLIVSAYYCKAWVDIDTIPIVAEPSTYGTVRITYKIEDGNWYKEIEFIKPRDGLIDKDVIEIFSDDVIKQIYALEDGPRSRMRVQQRLVEEDAVRVAKLIAAGDKNARMVGRGFLKSGSNPDALDIIRNSTILYKFYRLGSNMQYPFFEGELIANNVIFRLTIEGEKSYSGVLTFEIVDLQGKQIEYCKIKVEGADIILLDGALPVS